MKITKKIMILFLLLIAIIPTFVYAVPEKPSGEGSGGPGGSNSSSSNISYTGATTFSKATDESNKTYSSTTGSQNALLVSNGTSSINSCTINKSGDASGDNADFYGTNAAILTYNGAVLNIKGGTITTNGSHANAVFAYSNGTININDTTIKTTSNNSGAIMVTGGGTLTANNVNAETEGNSSAPIRSDRGGGNLTVNKGTYISHGTGSPVIYSTANIVVNEASLTSTSSEGVVVEGKNSVTLNNVTMEATNTKLNGNSQTYKAIFIYQSMSGDADVGTSSFTAKNSKITNNKGEIIFVTNTNTIINLENNEIINNDANGGFLKATTAKWGTSGSNGGNVVLNMTNQKANGDIIIDNISTLEMTMKDGSILIGSIDSSNQAKKITLSLSKDSILSLTADTYLTSLTNELNDNSNIYSNGKYKLYVDGKEVNINSNSYESSNAEKTSPTSEEQTSTDITTNDNNIIYYIIGGGTILIAIICISVFLINKNKKQNIY